MAVSKIKPAVRKKTVTASTNQNGVLFSDDIRENYVILGVSDASGNYTFVPYSSVAYGNGFLVFDNNMNNKITNTSVTVTYYYVEK